MADVVCAGILVADVVARPVRELPRRGELTLVEEMDLYTGGCAINTGAALAKLGIPTLLMGKVGEDGFGDFVRQKAQAYGLDIRGVSTTTAWHTSATMVMVDTDGERNFLHYLGANTAFSREDIDLELVRGAKIFHLGGFFLLPALDGEPAAAVLREVKAMGVTTSLDTAWDAQGRWMKLLEPCLPYVDVFLPSIEEAKQLTGREAPPAIAEFFLEAGVKLVGLKMGARGAYLRTASEEYWIPPFQVEAVDATGAGDSFVAGFLAGMCLGWETPRCGQLANAVGACCVTAMGASTGIKSLAETQAFMAAQGRLG